MPRAFAQRPVFPEHPWPSERGPIASFRTLPRYARWSIVLAFLGRLSVRTGAVPLWFVTLFQWSVDAAFIALPVTLVTTWLLAPLGAWRSFADSPLGPFRLCAIDDRCQPLPAARPCREAPQPLRQRVETFVVSWHVLTMGGVTALTVAAAAALSINDVGILGWLLMGLVVTAGVAASYYQIIAHVLGLKTPTHRLGLVA